MAATYQEVSLEEMTKFLTRGFHALRPKKSVINGEVVFDLLMSPKAGIRVWTSIGANQAKGADVGADAIRVQLYSFAKNKPLMPGKAPIVKRTQGWKDSLQDRIEDFIEKYDEKEEDIEAGRYIDWSK